MPSDILRAPDTALRFYPTAIVEMQAAAIKPNRLNSGTPVVIPANYGRAGGPAPTGGWRDYPQLDPYGPTNFDPYNPTYIASPKRTTSPFVQIPSPGYVLAQQDSPNNQPIGPVIGPAPSTVASLANLAGVLETLSP